VVRAVLFMTCLLSLTAAGTECAGVAVER